MPNYKIHIDKPLPDKQEIARHKDFERLYGQYQTATRFQFWRKLRTNPRYFPILVMLVAVGYLVWEATSDSKEKTQPWVSPPTELDIPYSYASISTDIGNAIELGENHLIHLAPGSFSDSSGRLVQGQITLAYRELSDARDLFIAGVPMRYDSAEKDYLLASGGMIELKAFQDSREIFLREGMKIGISYLLSPDEHTYRAYSLSTEIKSWQSLGLDSAVPVLDEQALLASLPARPRLQSVQDQETGEEVSDLELIPKGVKPPEAPAAGIPYSEKLAGWERLYQEARQHALRAAPVTYHFTASRLGYYCLGRVLPLPTESLTLTLQNEEGKNLSRGLGKNGQLVWVVQQDLTTLRPAGYDGEGHHILDFYPGIPTMVWTVTVDGKVAVIRKEHLNEEATQKGKIHPATLEIARETFDNADALKAFLDWQEKE